MPRWEEKYSRAPSDEKAGPMISDELCPLMRRNSATTSAGVMMLIFHIAAILSDEQVTGPGSDNVVDPGQRCPAADQ